MIDKDKIERDKPILIFFTIVLLGLWISLILFYFDIDVTYAKEIFNRYIVPYSYIIGLPILLIWMWSDYVKPSRNAGKENG